MRTNLIQWGRKFMVMLLALCMLVLFIPASVISAEEILPGGYVAALTTNFSGGDGTEASPFVITTAEQLAQLAASVNRDDTNFNSSHYILGNDIDLSAFGLNWNDRGWIPIGEDMGFGAYLMEMGMLSQV